MMRHVHAKHDNFRENSNTGNVPLQAPSVFDNGTDEVKTPVAPDTKVNGTSRYVREEYRSPRRRERLAFSPRLYHRLTRQESARAHC